MCLANTQIDHRIRLKDDSVERDSVSLAGIQDIQLMELTTRLGSKIFVYGLVRCITSDLTLGEYEQRR